MAIVSTHMNYFMPSSQFLVFILNLCKNNSTCLQTKNNLQNLKAEHTDLSKAYIVPYIRLENVDD